MKRIKHARKLLALLLCCCLGAALLVSCAQSGGPAGPSAAPSPSAGQPAGPGGQALTFGTMQAGTSTYAVGAALASVWNEHCPYPVTQQPMQVTGPAFRLLKLDQLDLAITTVWAIHGAYTGEDPFWDTWELDGVAPVPIQQICTGGDMRYGFFTTDPDIKTLKDLEGKKVYITQPGAESDIQIKNLLKAAGVDYGKITDVSFSSIDEAKQGLKEGRAVAVYWTASTWIQDIATTKPMYTVNISNDEVAKLNELLPGWGFVTSSVDSGEFGLSTGGDTLAVPFGIYVREGLSEDVVYDLTKAMYENHDQAVTLNPQYMEDWNLERALIAVGAPIHPGAVKYYKEAGVWTDEVDAQNTALLEWERKQ